MGYEVHITRAEEWLESESAPITLEEWLGYIEPDSEMVLARRAEAPGLTYKSEGLAIWKGYSKNEKGGTQGWFDLRNGRVIVKNPDPELLRKMHAIALRFGARVQGDDNELYDGEGEPCAAIPEVESAGKRRSWWRRLFGGDGSGTQSKTAPGDVAIKPGERMKDAFGNVVTVVAVHLLANGGLGAVTIRHESGREQVLALIASGLEPVTDE